jgi:pimeloyl-ACP methyl ester carboxylesterase
MSDDAVAGPADFDHGEREPVDASYVWIEFEGEKYRTYYETAGDGDVPLLCLHTAGADSRQYRHLLNDDDVLDEFTVYAFDMPWHGQTFPPTTDKWWTADYRLTTDFYAGFVVTFLRAIDLDRPAVLGCSMGGAIVLELARAHAEEVRAVIGLETTAHAPTRDIGYLDHPHVNQEVVRPEWTYGLQAPQSPERRKRESWWIYSQAGHGVYTGDLHFYANDWDARDDVEAIDTDECEVYLLTGEYDYSASPDDTRRVAEAIDGAHFEEMAALGHFPMVENPDRLKKYLGPVLDEIADG